MIPFLVPKKELIALTEKSHECSYELKAFPENQRRAHKSNGNIQETGLFCCQNVKKMRNSLNSMEIKKKTVDLI